MDDELQKQDLFEELLKIKEDKDLLNRTIVSVEQKYKKYEVKEEEKKTFKDYIDIEAIAFSIILLVGLVFFLDFVAALGIAVAVGVAIYAVNNGYLYKIFKDQEKLSKRKIKIEEIRSSRLKDRDDIIENIQNRILVLETKEIEYLELIKQTSEEKEETYV